MTRPRLHVVTNDVVLAAPNFADTADQLLAEGGAGIAFHVRGHATSAHRLYELAKRLRQTAESTRSSLFVNDRIDVALAVRAHGVQVGRRSMPPGRVRTLARDMQIGYSAHSLDEVLYAGNEGADFSMAGPVYETSTHPRSVPAGEQLIGRAAATAVDIVAIGGITPDRVPAIVAAGADGVAVISGIWSARQPAEALARYLEALDSTTDENRETAGHGAR